MKLSLLVLALGTAALSSTSAAPLLQYDFDGSGTTVTNTGTLGSAGNLSMYVSGGAAVGTSTAYGATTDLHSSPGVGGTGAAFDNTASSGMGNGALTGGGVAQNSSLNLGTIASFTITGWYNASAALGGNAKLVEIAGGSDTITLTTSNTNQLSLKAGLNTSTATPSAGSSAYSTTGGWVFFAVTYDGSLTSNNLNFYAGTQTNSVTQIGTSLTLNSGSIALGSSTVLGVGDGYNNDNRPFDGLIDSIGLYGAASGNGGVLSLSQLETVRTSAVPEPAAALLLPAAAALIAGFRRFRFVCFR